MIQEPLQQEILSRIDKLAEQFGVMWPELVRHTIVEAILGIVAFVVLAGFAGFAWSKRESCDDGWEITAVLATLFTIVAAGFLAFYCIPAILMPEAATFKALLP